MTDKICELKINNGTDRERAVIALVNAGYKVMVVKRKPATAFNRDDCYLWIEEGAG